MIIPTYKRPEKLTLVLKSIKKTIGDRLNDLDIYITFDNNDYKSYEAVEKTGLPYSNAIRTGKKRLTGLHFFEVQRYYSKVGDIIERYRKNFMNTLQKNNEEILYDIVEEGIGFGDRSIEQGKENFYRPHHGIHLGLYRVGEGDKCRCGTPEYVNYGTFQKIHGIIKNNLVNEFLKQRKCLIK